MNTINKYKYPGAKRLMLEAQEMKDNTEDYCAQPLDDNLFEWHFTLRGPPDTAFDGGYYHGRLIFPTEYPMKPPSIILLTPNGRFETNKKICLSISGFHPETWQPSWSVRTALLALIAFMPSKGNKAIGSLDVPDSERRRLAIKSRAWRCDTCGLIKDLLVQPNSSSESITNISSSNRENDRTAKPHEKIDDTKLETRQEGISEEKSRVPRDSSIGGQQDTEYKCNEPSDSSSSSTSNEHATDAIEPTQRQQASPSQLSDSDQESAQVLGLRTTSSREQVNLIEARRTYSPLVLKSIFLILTLLILRRIVMIVG